MFAVLTFTLPYWRPYGTATHSLSLISHTENYPIKTRQDYFTTAKEDNGSEIRQVVFAKVHKAASSTFQNILLRFALARNLNVLFPVGNYVINEGGIKIDPGRVVPHPEGKDKFDILCNHVIYNAREISKYFSDNATRVTFLREPMNQALSALTYYVTVWPSAPLKKGFEKYPDDPINGFLRDPQAFLGPPFETYGSFIDNRMSVDLGFGRSRLQHSKMNKGKIDAFIKNVENQFDFVLICEYFDESMVLLRRRLRWSMKDIIYLRSNKAKELPLTSPFRQEPIITDEVTKSFRQWANIDYELYEYFLPKFLQAIQSEPLFQLELKVFKTIEKDVSEFCSRKNNTESLHINANAWTKSFTVSKDDCLLMTTPEIPLVDLVRNKQLDRYKKWKASQPLVV